MAATDTAKHQRLDTTLDQLRARYGRGVVFFGSVQDSRDHAPMRISFTHIPDAGLEGRFEEEFLLPAAGRANLEIGVGKGRHGGWGKQSCPGKYGVGCIIRRTIVELHPDYISRENGAITMSMSNC
jgi:hypothetical protein